MEIVVLICLAVAIAAQYNILKTIRVRKRLGLKGKSNDQLFDQYFIEVRTFYAKLFNTIPCVGFINNVDTNKIFELIQEEKYGKVRDVYQRIYHDWDDDRVRFSKTIFVLQDNLMVKLADDWLEIYFGTKGYAMANKMLDDFKSRKAPEKEKENEINVISLSGNQLDLKSIAIKPTALNIDFYYNDDFKIIDALIRERLSKENDKGIVLLHGLPGTGKTTYLRYLVGSLKKKIMFVSPSVAGNLMNPEFMDLLLDNPNAILVIEDAENIIMERRYSSHSTVSNLLNISDGLLSDCLNVQIVCTFNSEIALVDTALLRKGRLIARYEFGKLSVGKANILGQHLGLKTSFTKPMTLAEITNPDDNYAEVVSKKTIGFRREVMMEN